MNMKVYGVERIRNLDAPAVFVGNHGAVYGAIAAMVYLPVHFRPWINETMLDRDSAARSILGTFTDKDNLMSDGVRLRTVERIAGLVSSAIKSFNPITVSRSNPIAMLDTIRETVDTLVAGDNVLIFPENPEVHYDDDSFRKLHPAFGILGFRYYVQSQKCLHFYPVFSDSGRKEFSIGEPVIYMPGEDERQEAMRIVTEIQGRLICMSEH